MRFSCGCLGMRVPLQDVLTMNDLLLRRSTIRSGRFYVLCIIFLLTVGFSHVAAAQEVQSIPDAESEFAVGITAFEAGDFETAYQSFRRVVDSFELNRKTTAARLMAGKSLYRTGQYDRAIDALQRFLKAFPGTRYERSARTTIRFAEEGLAHIAELNRVKQIGVLLPTSADDISLTQSLFNGFRIAIDQHNEVGEGRNPIRMVFAPSTGPMEQAFQDFEDAGVTAVFGPLYSREAIQAAELAESRGMVMLTPLATDEEVSEGKRFVFQGNPTLTVRGKLMARFAIESLSMTDFGILAEYNNSLSERMAEGFQDEVERLGGEMRFVKMINGTAGWFKLANQMKDDSLAGLDAIYLPITGGQAPSLIKAALDNIDQLELPIKLLGNKEWDDLPSRTQPSKYSATYTNDYRVTTSPLVAAFQSRYEELAGEPPGQLAFIGYDMGQYLSQLITLEEGPLVEQIRNAPLYQGISVKVLFGGGSVNQAMFYQRYRNGQIELLR